MLGLKCLSSVVVTCLFSFMIKADSSFFDLSTLSKAVTFSPNETVTFKCTVRISRSGDGSGVQWFRRQDTVSLLIANDDPIPYHDFVGSGRYKFFRGSLTSTTAEYYLTISNLQLEDSATIECGIARFAQRGSLAFVVCNSNEVCECMTRTGWSSPACFDGLIRAQSSRDSNRSAAIGLGLALAVMIIISVLLTVCVFKDCVKQRRSKREAQKAEAAAAPPPPTVTLAPPGASALKQPSHTSTTANGRAPPGVRFSEDTGAAVTSAAADDRRTCGIGASSPFPRDRISSTASASVVGSRAPYSKEINDRIGQNYGRNDHLYPPLPAEASIHTQPYGYGMPVNGAMNYTSPYLATPAGQLQVHSTQNSVVPRHTNALINGATRPEGFHSGGAGFVDPGSTSI